MLCETIGLVGTGIMGRPINDVAGTYGYGYTRGYGSGWVVILTTGRVRVRVTVLYYGYGSGSKNALPADLYYVAIN